MTTQLDPSLLAWVRGYSQQAKPTEGRGSGTKAKAEAGRNRADEWLRARLADEQWHAAVRVVAAGKAEGMAEAWLRDRARVMCISQRVRGVQFWQLRGEAK